ncbi:MAG: sporulation integral membrane protein YlbJ [Firmicutes bacterium]|nr:sporulation integral membrane protein YlbJ [Bacillota bacterium]
MKSIESPKQKGAFYLLALLFTLITISLAVYPQVCLEAAKEGLQIFGQIVFPSLFPFFVLTEVMLGLGIVHFIGVFLEPLMRPVFNVPGVGAFALSMGLAAGYPMDAVITGKFRRMNLCSQIEGERLLAFTNTADPLFMFGAVAVGMFGHPEIGAIIAIAHYLSAFTVGFIYRFYGLKERPAPETEQPGQHSENILKRAVREMLKAHREDNRPLGQLAGDAVNESISTLLMIGGFIIVFSVVSRLMEEIGLMSLILPGIKGLLKTLGLNPALGTAIIKGFLEIDLGTVAAAQAMAPLGDRLVVASAIIAWSGLSVHGQVISVIHETDIRIAPYLVARVLHTFLGGLYTFFLLGTLKIMGGATTTAFYRTTGVLKRWYISLTQLLIIIGILIGASLLFHFLSKFRLVVVEQAPNRRRQRHQS